MCNNIISGLINLISNNLLILIFGREDESEYDDFRKVKAISEKDLLLRSDEDFWCIGKSIEKAELHQIDPVLFITQTIQQLQPLYNRCHQ